MKKLFSAVLFLFVISFSSFAWQGYLSVDVVVPVDVSGKNEPLCEVGAMVDYKNMCNTIWGYEFGGYIGYFREGSSLHEFFDVNMFLGFPIRFFDTNNLEIYINPCAGLDVLYPLDRNKSISEYYYFWAGALADANYKISQYLYLNAGIFCQYYLRQSVQTEGKVTGCLYVLPKFGLTLVM